VQDTEASKQALKEAERAEQEKHAKWLEAEKAGQQADKFASDKLAKVESALNSQMASLTTESKVTSYFTYCAVVCVVVWRCFVARYMTQQSYNAKCMVDKLEVAVVDDS